MGKMVNRKEHLKLCLRKKINPERSHKNAGQATRKLQHNGPGKNHNQLQKQIYVYRERQIDNGG